MKIAVGLIIWLIVSLPLGMLVGRILERRSGGGAD
jgi:hypothetical protein